MSHAVKIGDRWIGEGHPCFVIAEVGINHNGDLDLARKLIFRDESDGDPLQKYMNHFAGLKGKPAASTTAHVDTLSVEDKLKFAIINGEKSVGEGARKKVPTIGETMSLSPPPPVDCSVAAAVSL